MSDEVELNGDVATGSEDFDAGFSGAPTETPGQTESSAKDDTVQPEQGREQGQEQQQGPKFKQITEEEFERLNSSAAAIEEMKATLGKQADTIFGRIGGLERVLKQFQDQTPAGSAVEITEDDLAELRDEFPELIGPQLKMLQRIAGKMRGTGQAFDESQIQPMLEKATPDLVARIRSDISAQIATETLTETHPDWESVVGNTFAGKPADKEFLEWANAQPQEYRDRLFETVNPVVIGRAIDKFREHQASLKKNAERRERFEKAVTPKGDGGHEPPPDGDEAFEAGFNGR